MHNLTYRRILREDDTDIPQLIKRYQLPEVTQYIGIGDHYFRYVTGSQDVFFYKVFENNTLIGAAHLEKHDSVLYVALLVFPEYQKTGIGTKILADIQQDIFGLGCERIEASVDERNTASLRLFTKAGFICTAKEDELIRFVYQRKNS